VTYNLHPILRFDLELEMLEGRLAVRDLPEAWRARYEADLGIVPPSDSDGVMQDVHWYSGFIGGAFQAYTLGNMLSAQFLEAATAAHPEIPSEIADGCFETLLGWYRSNVHQHGRKFLVDELVERVTGQPLTAEPYLRYLREKYGKMYGISL
jgi:carboxypeptidase Taq